MVYITTFEIEGCSVLFFLMIRRPPRSTPFPCTTLFRSVLLLVLAHVHVPSNTVLVLASVMLRCCHEPRIALALDRDGSRSRLASAIARSLVGCQGAASIVTLAVRQSSTPHALQMHVPHCHVSSAHAGLVHFMA